MQPYYYARSNRPKRSSALLPFVSLIVIILIGVLIFQIFDYFSEKRRQALENKAAVEVVSGRADFKIWGVDEWAEAHTGAILHEGDSLKTSPGSRVVLTLLNGSSVRVSSETEVELTNLKTRDGQDELGMLVKMGEVWVKRTENEAVNASFTVSTKHLEVASLGTIFSVSAAARESVRVMDGAVKVTLRVPEPEDEETIRIADTVEVEFGQEVSIGQEEIRQLQNRRPVQLLALLDDTYRDTEWYKWNRLQDSVGVPRLSVADAVSSSTGSPLDTVTTDPSTATAPTPDTTAPQTLEVTVGLSAPTIVSPISDARTITSGQVTIAGTVSSATQKVEVTTYTNGKTEPYILQKYVPGSTNWSYAAASNYGNLVAGDNRYTFVAIDKNGTRSESSEIIITYNKPAVQAELTAPVVLSFNGSSSNETSEDLVTITGTIGKGIQKVFVNDFALSRYIPDSGSWSYYAKTELGNLKVGENSFTVYGVDADGKRTPTTTFTITKTAKPDTVVAPQ